MSERAETIERQDDRICHLFSRVDALELQRGDEKMTAKGEFQCLNGHVDVLSSETPSPSCPVCGKPMHLVRTFAPLQPAIP